MVKNQAYGLLRLVEESDSFECSFIGNLNDKLKTALVLLEEINEEEEISTASILTSVRTAKRALSQAVKRAQ
ncbi:hypothetical protein [Sulfurimonas sp. RIFOXYD2_FULL_34_21]|uniref:hypothetical protein n=1 Tax=Sulfurimonas sp. RIFOXYD2_FULL_34_21 TaxID=1802261 RepID=UPI0008CE88DD|nr:hypothetical protein [Sulfurimonas sp. RIFOXYD2_FULL_34_21]OHE14127.1 MAG: hypothetical protein A2530_05495 [Sulfurimonas sp. RIFOXYD2_FULL_34_21]